jgi:hypothetical protein
MCPVVDCPANVSHLLRRSGCVYNYLGGKKSLDTADIAYAFGVPTDTVKEQVADGRSKIKLAVILQDIVSRLRDNAEEPSCPHCGIFKSTRGPCLNKILCDERIAEVDTVSRGYPYNIPELSFERRDLFLLIKNIKKVREFLRILNEQSGTDIKVHTLLGLPKETIEKLKELATKRT